MAPAHNQMHKTERQTDLFTLTEKRTRTCNKFTMTNASVSNPTCCQSLLTHRALSLPSLVQMRPCCTLLQSTVMWLPAWSKRTELSCVCVCVCVGVKDTQRLYGQELFLSRRSRPQTWSPHFHVSLLRVGKQTWLWAQATPMYVTHNCFDTTVLGQWCNGRRQVKTSALNLYAVILVLI